MGADLHERAQLRAREQAAVLIHEVEVAVVDGAVGLEQDLIGVMQRRGFHRRDIEPLDGLGHDDTTLPIAGSGQGGQPLAFGG